MAEEYPYAGYDWQQTPLQKRPWEMTDYGLPGQWEDKQHQDKRLCLPSSSGDINVQMQVASAEPLPLCYAGLEPLEHAESSPNFHSLLEASNLPWSDDLLGAWSPSLQSSPNPWGDPFFQSASLFSLAERDSFNTLNIPQTTVPWNIEGHLNENLCRDATIWMDDRSTEREMSSALLLQSQQLDSLQGIFTPPSISENSSRPSYGCSEIGVSESVPRTLVDGFEYPCRTESPISTRFEKNTPENKIIETCSSLQPQATQDEENLEKIQAEKSEEIYEDGYDTCFGMIKTSPIKIQSSFLEIKSDVDQEVNLKICNNMVIIHSVQTTKYGGLLDRDTSKALTALSRNFLITFRAFLDKEAPTLKKGISNHCRTLQIILYGLRQDSNAVGTLLSENKLYLQQPTVFDSSAVYFNPQYLLRPGTDFKLPVQEDFQRSVHEKEMTQAVKYEILRVFDAAVGPTTFSEVQVSKRLTTDLKSYQRKALAMMVEKESGKIENLEFPSLWVSKTRGGRFTRYWNSITGHSQSHPPPLCLSGLLADEMGLGKTLTMLTLIAGSIDGTDNLHHLKTRTLETSSNLHASNTTLIITPLSTLSTWEEQIRKHFQPCSIKYLLYHGAEREQDISNLLQNDIIITTYDTLKAETLTNSKRKLKGSGLLHSIDWCRVVLDEAHVIRNRSSQVFNSVYTLQARYRWCLTGTPIQNRIEDLGALVSFLRVYPFDNKGQFYTNFVDPIRKGNNIGVQRLKALVQAISLRRTKQSVFEELTLRPRVERVQSVELNEEERTLYNIAKRSWTYAAGNSGSTRSIFQTIMKLRQICDHGRELLSSETLAVLDQGNIDGGRFEVVSREPQLCENCGAAAQAPDSDESVDYLLTCLHLLCDECLPKNQGDNTEAALCPVCSGGRITKILSEDEQGTNPLPDSYQDAMDIDLSYRPSSKVLALLQNLCADRLGSANNPIKSVVFTSWTRMLDMVEKALTAEGIIYQRIDGGKSLRHRRHAIQSFRNNSSCTVLLASIGSAGVGLDLTAASRVHLLEAQWNPMAEEQALDRVHRLGQTREVIAIRYIVRNSIEEYIKDTQREKLNLIQASFGDGTLSHADIIKERLKNLRAALN